MKILISFFIHLFLSCTPSPTADSQFHNYRIECDHANYTLYGIMINTYSYQRESGYILNLHDENCIVYNLDIQEQEGE